VDKVTSLRVLIAEDSLPDRLILEAIIKGAGHDVCATCDGQEAVEAFKAYKPDVVLLDLVMPKMDGLEALKCLRNDKTIDLVPIIFLTSHTDTNILIKCLEAGGADFISKPYNAVVLQTKIKAFGRMHDMQKTVISQRDELERHHKHLIQEQQVAKQVFDKIAHTGMLDLDNIRYSMSPLAVFNGDILVAEVSPSGNLLVLMGDFTGHGLPAAVGSMPLATTFYGMVKKGFSLPDVLSEINSKLNEILPIGFFCCATCVEINFKDQTLFTWTGGLPPSYLYRHKSDDYKVLNASNLPLGVLDKAAFKAEPMRIELDYGDKIYMWSDGIFESRDKHGDMFGQDRLDDLMHEFKGDPALFDHLLNRVQDHIGENSKDDDISLLEIDIQDVDLVPNIDTSSITHDGMQDWNMAFTLQANSLQQFDPLPLLINIITQVPGLKKNRTTLYTVLAELYANALEHGILTLKSIDKRDPKGFTAFYAERKKRLDALAQGFVSFKFSHIRDSSGGLLNIHVQDSGEGYDFKTVTKHLLEGPKVDFSAKFHGRGLALLYSMCEKIVIHEPGNYIEAHFRWNE